MNYFHEIRGRQRRQTVFENDGTWHVISGRRYALRPHVPLDPEKCRLMLGLLNGADRAKNNKRLRRKLLTLALTLAMGMIAPNFAKPAQAAVYTAACNAGVGDTADLIAKMAAANLAGGQNTINLGTNCVYDITLTDNNYYGPTGLPAIISDLTIEGNGAKIQRSGVNKIRFFYVGKESTGPFPSPDPGTLTLRNLTLSGGYQMGGSGGGGGAGMGGAIFNHGTLKLEGVTLQGNYAYGGNGGQGLSSGGGIGGYNGYVGYNRSCDNIGNYVAYGLTSYGCPGGPGGGGGYGAYGGAGGFGGGGGNGIHNSGNGGFGGGGGYYASSGGFGGGNGGYGYSEGGPSSYSGGGGAGLGGAVFNHLGTVTIKNSTFTANYATGGGSDAFGGSGYGAALFNLNGTVTIINSTISGNYVYSGGGGLGNGSANGAVYNLGYDDSSGDTSAAMTLINTIIANTTGGDDLVNEGNPGITTATVDATNNAPNIVVNKLNGGGSFEASFLANLNNADPMLSALADNGGLTWTMALDPNSPALGAGINSTGNPAVPAIDQRGYVRDINVDIGAYEYGAYDYSLSETIVGGLTETFEAGGTFPSPVGLNSLTWGLDNQGNMIGETGFYAKTGLGGCGEGGPPAYNIMALPVIDLSGKTSIILEYSWYFQAGFHQDDAAVQISIDNGVTWDTVWNSPAWAQNAVYGPNTSSIDISEYAAGQAAVIIRFLYTSVDACQGNWQVDDIKVLADQTLLLTKTGTGAGTLTADSGVINCGAACLDNYYSGTQVTLTASPAEGSTFTGWSGCDSVNGLNCTVTMNNGRTVTADFSLTALTAGLVSLWKGEDNAKDSFGGNHGTLNNGVTYTTGKSGKAFSFDGIDDLVQINSTGIFKGQSEATIEAWVRPKGAHSNDEGFGGQVYAENTGSSDWTRFGIYVFNNGSVHGFGRPGESGASFDAVSAVNIPLNQWSHLAATWKADEGVRVYVNGILQGSVNAAVGAFTGTDSSLMSIGAGGINAGSPKYVFNGDIDGLGIYTRALSASEVLTNYYRANGLVAEWKGDGNAYNSVGNDHGTLMNGATFAQGLSGQAFSFDGTNDYVAVNAALNVPVGNGSYTFEAWIKPDTMGSRGIIGWGAYGFNNQVNALRLGPTGIYNYWWSNDLYVETGDISGSWHHVAATYDQNTNSRYIYLDGTLVGGDNPASVHIVPNANNLTIGMTNGSEFFDGLIDEVQIFNRALSAGEITAIYTSGLRTDIVSSVSSGNGQVICDESFNCTITPEAGYHIVDVMVDGASAGPVSSYQFDNDRLTHTLEAIFAEGLFALLPNTMTVGRGGHTQTLLNDGKVLIAGGFTGSAPYMPTATAELYDPVAKTFTATGSMSTPRSGHTATLLQDGRVLIAGGSGCSAENNTCAYLNTIEIYSPAEGTFSFVRNMFSGRSDHTATLLQDGKVLIAGGVSGIAGWVGTFLDDAEIYDPSDDNLTHLENALNGNRAVHTATLLNNGTVLIAGGRTTSGETYLNSTLIFDHSDDIFSVGSNMKQARVYHDAVLMNDGRVLFLGGYLGGASSSAEVFNPIGNAFDWTSNNMPIGRRSPTAVVLANGKVLVVGGSDGNGWNGGREYSDIYNPVTNTFINGGKMSFARVAPVTLLSDGSVLAAGGFPLSWGQPIYDTAEIYNGYDSFSLTVNSPANGTISCGPTNVLRGNSRDCVIAAGSGYFLSSLTDNGVSVIGAVSGNIYSITNITANHDINAVFSLPPVNGVCGTSSGQTLTAAPTANLCSAGTPASLSGSGPWTWTCQGQNSGTNASCSANIQTYTVTPSAGSGGGISPNTPLTVNYGSVPSFTVTPDTGYSVNSVTGCGVLLSGSSYIAAPITADCTVTATFTPNLVNGLCGASNGQTLTAAPALNLCSAGTPSSVSGTGPWNWNCSGLYSGTNASCSANIQTYALSVNTSGTGSGTVTGAGTYNHGQTVIVGATADASSIFSGWSGDCSGTDNSTAVLMSGVKTCTAAFTLKTYTVTTGAGPNGKISCAPATVNHGASSICTITPDADYQIEDIEEDGVSVGKAATYSMSNITSDCTVTASFSIKKYDLSITKSGSGTVMVSPPGGSCGTDCFTYNKNQRVTVTAKAEKDHIFTGWTGSCSGKGICQITMSSEKSVTVNFEAAAPVISVAPDGPQDFGNVRIGRLKTKTLKITNNGTGNLRITSIEIDGADSDMFSKRSGTAIIKPGKSSNLRVTFKPKSSGTQSGTLRINSNDSVTPVVEIALTGAGTLKK